MSDGATDGITAHSPLKDHLYTPPVGRAWALCTVCGLSGVSHVDGPAYEFTAPYRCPYCVHVGIDPCSHTAPLSMKGEYL